MDYQNNEDENVNKDRKNFSLNGTKTMDWTRRIWTSNWTKEKGTSINS